MAFEELKERHAAMWGSAPFEHVAGTLADMHEAIVAAVGGGPGERWLDVGCGTGELAFMAAATGAEVTGSDLAPALVETARRQAAERGLDTTFEVADVEALPYDDGELRHRDLVGRRHLRTRPCARSPSELARVCRPGGQPRPHRLDDGRQRSTSSSRSSARTRRRRRRGRASRRPGESPATRRRCSTTHFDLTTTDAQHAVGQGDIADEIWKEMSEAFGPIKTLLARAAARARGGVQERDARVLRERAGRVAVLSFDRPYLLVYGVRKG